MNGDEWIENSPTEKDLRILVNESWIWAVNVHLQPRKPTVSWAASKEVWSVGWREGVTVRLHLEYFIQSWGLQYKKDMDLLEWLQWRVVKIVWGLGHFCEEKLRQLGMFRLEKRRFHWHPISAFQHVKRTYEKGRGRLFTGACTDRTRDNGCKLKESGCRLDIRIFLW